MRLYFPAAAILLTSLLSAAPVINEVQSTNTSLPDQYGQFMDWVEIYNPTNGAIDLSGYRLSDSLNDRSKFVFPAVSIGPGGYLLVWCGQSAEFPVPGPYPAGQLRSASFAISSGGESIVLTAPDGATVVDEFPALPIGTSGGIGRSLGRGTAEFSGTLFFYAVPTQGAANTTVGLATEALPVPSVSQSGGVFRSAVTVQLSVPAGLTGATLRYTLDGSDPTESSPAYDGPITLTATGNASTQYSWIPTNYQQVGWPFYEGWQPPQGGVARLNVLRTRILKAGVAPGRIVTHSYLVHPDGAGRYPYPVVSIATDPGNLFDRDRGIYVPPNFSNDGSAWERPGHIEFFETDGSLAFAGDIGIRLHGNTTVNRPRKALRIYARNPDGPSTFNHRIFPQKDTAFFDTFLLRAGGNDWGQAIFRDALVSEIAAPSGLDHMSARPAVVFIDGEYWGLHNLRDRIDEGYYFHRYDLGETEFTQLEIPAGNSSWPVYDRGNDAAGLLQDFEDILGDAADNEFGGAAGYDTLADRIDIANFIDYQAHEIWSGNTDWPGNNVRLWRSVTPDRAPGASPRHDGRWRWILFDTDFALGLDFFYVPGYEQGPEHNTLAYASQPGGGNFIGNSENGTLLLRKALENTRFRNEFINRFADLLNTALSAEQAGAKLEEFRALYAPGMPEHVARWNQPGNWNNELARIGNYLALRPAALRGHLAERFGLAGAAELTVGVAEAGQGSVKVNSLVLEPSTPGVSLEPYPWTGTYFQSVPVTLTALPAPGYRLAHWLREMGETSGTVIASDSAAASTSWSSGSNGGTGFGAWSLEASTTNRGNAGWFLSNSRGGWGFYANNEHWAAATRPLAAPLAVGQTFTVRLRHGTVASPGDVGIALLDNNEVSYFRVRRTWSSDRYEVNGQISDVPVTTGSLDVEFTMTSATTYAARLTPVGGSSYQLSGALPADGTNVINRFQAFNYSAGNGGGADFFITSMQIAEPGAEGGAGYEVYSTSTTITPTLSADTGFVAAFEPEPAVALAIEPPVWTAGAGNAPLTVRAVNSLGDTDGNFDGIVVLTVTGSGGVVGIYSAAAVGGLATFPALDLPAGSYQVSATSGDLATDGAAELTVRAAVTFLPAGSGVWHLAANWDANAVPNSASASVIIPPSTAANRDVTNNAPTTVASVTFELGSSAFRSRINGTAGQPFTLASTSGISTVTVNGTGAGHANIEVPGGLVISNQVVLDVQNTGSTNAEYGALRLQGLVSGPGSMVKRGPGMAGITGAGKTFSGNITIEQGVLTFSEPAITANNVTNYSVQSGGQLRLSSAGNPRNYLFKGPLHLAGSGRSGVPENESLGVLGALRLETGRTGTVAVLTNRIHLNDSADVHVPAGNAMQLGGPLTTSTNTNVLAKSGGGTLVLSGHASAFTGGLAVSRGVLRFDAAMLTNTVRALVLTNETVLTGTGRWGGSLVARDGSALAFFPGLSPGDVAPLRAGSFAAIGTVTIAVTPGEGAVAGAYPLLAVDGTAAGLDSLSLALASTNFPAGSLSFSNGTLYAVLSATVNPATAWLAQYGLPTDGSGNGAADADPDADGLVNLFERALFSNPLVAEPRGWTVTIGSEVETFVVTYRVARDQNDLTVSAESSPVLGTDAVWTALASKISDDTHPDYVIYRAVLPQVGTSGFVRLKVMVRAGL